jgi:hypothetical protein
MVAIEHADTGPKLDRLAGEGKHAGRPVAFVSVGALPSCGSSGLGLPSPDQ